MKSLSRCSRDLLPLWLPGLMFCWCLLVSRDVYAQEDCCACSPKIPDSQCSVDCNAMRLPRCPSTTLAPAPPAREVGTHGWIGVALGRDVRPGALVVSVAPASPAASAGLQPSDEIVGFDGNSIPNRDDLIKLVRQEPLGRHVRIDIMRAGQHLQGEIVIGQSNTGGNPDEHR